MSKSVLFWGYALLVVTSIPATFLQAWVLMTIFNTFATPLFGVQIPSVWYAFGLTLIFSAMSMPSRDSMNLSQEERFTTAWAQLISMLIKLGMVLGTAWAVVQLGGIQ